jgi:predicted HTH domain antitoxin
MIIEIPDSIIQLSEKEKKDLQIDIALLLYDRELISLGKAGEMTGLDYFEIRGELKKRGMFIKLGIEDLQKDLENISKLP